MFDLSLGKSIEMILLLFTFSLSNIAFCAAYIFPLCEDTALSFIGKLPTFLIT